MTGMFGTACGNGTYIAVRFPSPASNSLGTFFTTHAFWQAPQPLHFVSSTLRAFCRMRTRKFPMYPSTASTSL